MYPAPPPPPLVSRSLQVHPSDVAAIILEPVLGEGGFLTPPPGFMKALRQLADKHGIMVIADEVSRVTSPNCTIAIMHTIWYEGDVHRAEHGIMLIAGATSVVRCHAGQLNKNQKGCAPCPT